VAAVAGGPSVQERISVLRTRGSHDPNQRDQLLDNAKGLLIFLVVVGHALATVHGPGTRALSVWIYLFHMPAFVLICGMLSRRYATIDHGRVQALLRGLVLPYVLFQVLLVLMERWEGSGEGLSVTKLLTPVWPLWFLPALFLWRMATPFLSRLRFPLLWALLASLLAPLSSALDWTLGINRTLSFLPFFVLGLGLQPRHLRVARRWWLQLLGAAVLIGAVPVAAGFKQHLSTRWLYWSDTYAMLKVGLVEGASTRLLLMGVALFMLAALFALVPAGKTFFTSWGTYSMYPLLLHAVLVRLFRVLGWGEFFDGWVGSVLFVLACGLMTAAMASLPVRTLFKPLVQPPSRWLERA
jgi:fucose 4-O-acetylase-like acetyltransferase